MMMADRWGFDGCYLFIVVGLGFCGGGVCLEMIAALGLFIEEG